MLFSDSQYGRKAGVKTFLVLTGISVALQGFCAKNYTKVVTDFQKLLNNSRFRQKTVLKPILHNVSWCKKSFIRKKLF